MNDWYKKLPNNPMMFDSRLTRWVSCSPSWRALATSPSRPRSSWSSPSPSRGGRQSASPSHIRWSKTFSFHYDDPTSRCLWIRFREGWNKFYFKFLHSFRSDLSFVLKQSRFYWWDVQYLKPAVCSTVELSKLKKCYKRKKIMRERHVSELF